MDIFGVDDQRISPKYDDPFFKKNKIRMRYTFTIYRSIDIVVKIIDKDFLDVVTNFDFTFCEIWFDGTNLYTTSEKNYENIKLRNGILKSDYHQAYYDVNMLIHSRLLGYHNRGYVISIEGNRENIIKSCQYKNKKKTIDNEEEYIVKTLIKILFNSCSKINKYMLVFFENILNEHNIPSKELLLTNLSIIEVIFVSEMKEFTLNELLNKIIFYEKNMGGSLYIYLFVLLELRMNDIRVAELKKYNIWYFYTFLRKQMYRALILKYDKESPRELLEKVNDVFDDLLIMKYKVHKNPPFEFIREQFKKYEISDKQYKKAHQLAYEELYKIYPNQCKLINPMTTYDGEKHKKQLECYTSSSENTELEIIQKYLYIHFSNMVKYDFYYKQNKLISINHDLSLPPDMIDKVNYNPNATTFDII